MVEKNRVYRYPKKKVCTGTCGRLLPLSEYWSCNARGKLRGKCRTCYKIHNGDKPKKRFRRWYYEKGGKEKCQLAWEKYKSIRNADNKTRRETDKSYAIEKNVRSRIYEMLRKNGTSRKGKANFLGMDIKTYRKWLEYQFHDGMSWKNYGEYWHIDYVRPCDSFIFTSYDDDAIHACFNWKNTRPMIKKDNLSKGNKIDHVAIAKHNVVVWMFKLDYGLDADD